MLFSYVSKPLIMRHYFIIFFLFLSLRVVAAVDSVGVAIVQRLDSLCQDSLLTHSQLGLVVYDLTGDTLLYAHNEQQLMRPASCQKVFTAIAALHYLGTDYDFTTSLYRKGEIKDNRLEGDLVVRAGFDPLFSTADMQQFVESVRSSGVRSVSGGILLDLSVKDTLSRGAGWCWDDDDKLLSPLYYNGKLNFATELKRQLKAAGINVKGRTRMVRTMPSDARLLCHVRRPIAEVLKPMMKESDNLCAESVFYQLAARQGRPYASATDAIDHIEALTDSLGYNPKHYKVADGSGLSLYNYSTPQLLAAYLRYAYTHPSLFAALNESLPIAGVDGTLKKRMRSTLSYDNVRAKTGSVTAVSTLAGYCIAPNGHYLCFAIMNQGLVRASHGRAFQDRVCAALTTPLVTIPAPLLPPEDSLLLP